MDEVTVCYDCLHFLNSEPTGPRKDIWYNHRCGAISLPLAINPITGCNQYYQQNSLGETYFADQEHPYCRNMNDGNCKRFRSKEPS